MIQITRANIITLSNAAYQLEDYNSSRRILIAWMKKYPNDLWIRYRLAIVLYKLGEYDNAIRLCELITNEDPEFAEVWGLLTLLYPENSADRRIAERRAVRLKAGEPKQLQSGKGLFGRFRKDRQQENASIEEDDFDLLTAAANARMMVNDEDHDSAYRILGIYHRRWPKAIQFKLVLGHILNQMGRVDEGMQVIQSAVEADVIGQTAERVWRKENPYASLWPDVGKLWVDGESLDLPAAVVKLAGLTNVLPVAAEPEETRDVEEISVEEKKAAAYSEAMKVKTSAKPNETDAALVIPDDEPQGKSADYYEQKQALPDYHDPDSGGFWGRKLEKLTSKSQAPIGEYVYKLRDDEVDSRDPVYVVMSTVTGLNKKYGANNKGFIDQEMQSLADAVANRRGWKAQVYYPDEFISAPGSGMTADKIHAQLVRLDEQMREKNEMIGALLIVGDDDIVPFFEIRNPVGDDDIYVSTDAPYGSLDSKNCYEMQWMVGRVPGDDSGDAGLLMKQLREIQNYHIVRYSSQKSGDGRVGKKDRKKFAKSKKTLGCTCAAWLTPSTIVYKTIADTSSLLVSPATTAVNFPSWDLDSCDHAYFNLHGIKGQPNWYGQKKADDTSGGPTIPVALQINNVAHIQNTPKVVFTECCYGGETKRRNESNCMCLHFLGKTTRAFIGSTTIAYGALTTKLTAADLLGYLFWKHLLTGITCGEAFRRARKNLATEMENKTGGLDAEIQKTLLSFVYYGDPLYAVDDSADVADLMERSKSVRIYELLGEESSYENYLEPTLSHDIYKEVKKQYHINSAADEYSQCMVRKQLYYNKTGKYVGHAFHEQDNYVITYVKEDRVGNLRDRTTIRVTVRTDGTILNVSFSR